MINDKFFSQYDNLASVYDMWSKADPAAHSTEEFYKEISSSEDEIVELGIGNGRIAIGLAELGKKVIGIDISKKMLRNCRHKVAKQGLTQQLELINADIRFFSLKNPANIIIMPFRTFGHLISLQDKQLGFKNVYQQMKPGGVFIFDHYVINENWAKYHNGVPRLMVKTLSGKRKLFVWDTYIYDFDKQLMDCTITIEYTNEKGKLRNRIHNDLKFSWISPSETQNLLIKSGFQIINSYGSFDKQPLTETSKEQIWIVRRPEG